MAQRQGKRSSISRVAIALTAAAVVEKGCLACLSTATGKLVEAGVATTLVPIGYFDEDATGDGTTLVHVRLFKEVTLHWFENDLTNPVTAADIGDSCYIQDERTVTSLATGASVAGRVWALNSVDGVGVEIRGFSAG